MIKFKTFKSDNVGMTANGTHLQGYVNAYYHQLVEVFGEPTYSSGGDKTTVEWVIEFKDGTIATIYDWKCYETPMGEYEWHIGGFDYAAVNHVQAVFSQQIEKV